MNDQGFQFDNVWHVTPHMLYGFRCHGCDTTLGFGQVPVGDRGEGLKKYCVAVAHEAQTRGWIYMDDFRFRCPQCAEAAIRRSAHRKRRARRS